MKRTILLLLITLFASTITYSQSVELQANSPFIFFKTENTSTGNAGLTFRNSSNSTRAVINYNLTEDHLRIVNGSSTTDGIYVAGNNNFVGIGENNPTAKLHIRWNSQPTSPQLNIYENNNDYSRVNFTNFNTDDLWTISAKSADDPKFSQYNIYSTHVGDILSLYGDGNARLRGFTKLGVDAPLIKMKKLTGTTDNDASTSILHGLTASKILDVSVVIANGTTYYPDNENTNIARKYRLYWTTSYITLADMDSSLWGDGYTVLITYEE